MKKKKRVKNGSWFMEAMGSFLIQIWGDGAVAGVGRGPSLPEKNVKKTTIDSINFRTLNAQAGAVEVKNPTGVPPFSDTRLKRVCKSFNIVSEGAGFLVPRTIGF